MRILVTASCSEGLVLPLVPIAWALRSAGHEVLVAAPENMAKVVVEAGLPYVRSAAAVEMPEVLSVDRDGEPVPMPREEAALLRHIGRGYARLALRLIDGLRDIAKRWRPDLIVSETYGFAGPLLAAELGIPWIEQGMRLVSPPSISQSGADELAPELKELGLSDLPSPLLSLDLCPPGIRGADGGPAQKMRFVPYNGRASGLPDWVHERRDKPRLCLTFGTRVPLNRSPIKGGFSLLEQLMHRLPELGVEVVVAVSDEVSGNFTKLPGGVRVAGQLPLNQILPGCDLIVHHGGVGTTLTALALGVPQVTVPVIAEVWESARLLVASGAGRQVPFIGATADGIFDACAAILGEPSYRRNAGRLREEIAALPSPADVVRRIEELLS
ncbi:glycosyltransferase/glycosyltransferase [Amycolatopsis xylanica]|uniref:Glycosyltransferase/glycosyltransferase n=1 Tax=Amycolatopsis xylanica TaxID=589385 RepID=A0A1H2VRX5_9PSEU|nr:nucleotide disphospho-sugar-binding domain-containing protein [Amycolatopsis xylanica]SDW71026.1 glycosyltransferase/glycosyltransferase [Amycolatopsis xylanica]